MHIRNPRAARFAHVRALGTSAADFVRSRSCPSDSSETSFPRARQANPADHSRRKCSRLARKKVPIQNRMRTRILIVNHLFCVHCCAVYTVPGNGRLPVPVTWMGSVHRHDSGGIFLCTSQHRARTAPGSLGPSHADYCLRQRLSLYVAQYRPLPARCQDTFRPKHEKYRPKPAFSVSLSSIE